MPDPIHGLGQPAPIEPTQPGTTGARTPAPAEQSPAGSGADSADVAGAEALLQTISTAADAVPTVDETRIAELQQAIKNGTYQADPQQIATKILEIEKLLSPGAASE